MAYDEKLVQRVRACIGGAAGLTEKRMFGGLAFLINGNMAVSASGQGGLLLRVDPATTDGLVEDPGAERFVMRGREMDGWLAPDRSQQYQHRARACTLGGHRHQLCPIAPAQLSVTFSWMCH